MVFACFYILYAGIFGRESLLLWISISLLVLESIVLLINKWVCPFTSIAMKYTENRSHNFDIYLPEAVAKYNKMFFGSIFILGLVLVGFNYFSN